MAFDNCVPTEKTLGAGHARQPQLLVPFFLRSHGGPVSLTRHCCHPARPFISWTVPPAGRAFLASPGPLAFWDPHSSGSLPLPEGLLVLPSLLTFWVPRTVPRGLLLCPTASLDVLVYTHSFMPLTPRSWPPAPYSELQVEQQCVLLGTQTRPPVPGPSRGMLPLACHP